MSRCICTWVVAKCYYSDALSLINWNSSRGVACPYLLFVTQWHVSSGKGRIKAYALPLLILSSSEWDQMALFVFLTSIIIGICFSIISIIDLNRLHGFQSFAIITFICS